ncbi:peptidoglycan DD-metalloendopeptidase family protein [Telmatospirillum sp. J64-1]|uniref:peptidoglycan DD-metalloendopeptidase family protein n=1 Tax=Telmatospirillum sp. J64-1 TaxID=2502183 RepID=UPI00115C971F|nr:peptidoglycan DD-metalloendopeptidase family protein [Telmatospirillum sp. J64-1]
MALTARTGIMLAAIGVIGLGGGWYALPSKPKEESQKVVTIPTTPIPVYEELEQELPAPALVTARTDSQIEDEKSRPILHVVEVDRGDTLLNLLLKVGVERAEAMTAIDALRKVYNPRQLRVGQQVTVSFERPADGIGTGPFNGIILQPEAGRLVSAQRDENGFQAAEEMRETTRQIAKFGATIESSLFAAASSTGLPAPVVVEMMKALSYDVDFQRDIRSGDNFEVLVERFYDNKGNLVREGDLLYASLTLSGRAITLYRYEDSAGIVDWYTANGESVRKALLRTPVDGARISSNFGMRKHPILGYSRMHKGVDFAVPIGTPVMAAGDGVVEKAGNFGAYGYYVRIRHSDKYATAYAHLSRFAQGVRAGARVRQGQIIAYSGNTGRSTGPHLHYEVLAGNEQVNPLSVKFQSGNKLAGKELQKFKVAMAETERMLAQLPYEAKVAAKKTDTATRTN